ncbi:hypothetical protein [Albimonas pacifica]|uniref:Sulfotransferase family protein n=1 Tax=Albimonas pacifica TaxID=1114924 RepID=A0A1I3BXF4_9RHOB|nr:hypothetical protein [Albimonas pacifica]SFH66736.1 hypothetical protein SAMN05216258_101402 [Albimonas pacifica]
MTDRLLIHLGDCKTGTTAIQNVLKQGAWSAEGLSWTYPVDPDRLHHCILASTLHKPKLKASRAPIWGRVNRRLAASDADLGILSGEWFEFVDPALMQRTLERFLPDLAPDARLIAYVRPHAERVLSSFQERTKLGQFKGSLDEFHDRVLGRGRFNYAPRLRRWREVFGDRYEVRPMIREVLKDGDVVHDFLDFATQGRPFTVDDGAGGGMQANESVSVQDLAWLRALHRTRQLPQQVGRRAARALQSCGRPGDKLRLDAGLLERVRAAYLEDARILDAEFFGGGGAPGPMEAAFDRAAETALETPQDVSPERWYDAGELRRIEAMAEVFAADAADLRRAKRQLRKARGGGGGRKGGGGDPEADAD